MSEVFIIAIAEIFILSMEGLLTIFDNDIYSPVNENAHTSVNTLPTMAPSIDIEFTSVSNLFLPLK